MAEVGGSMNRVGAAGQCAHCFVTVTLHFLAARGTTSCFGRICRVEGWACVPLSGR